METLTATQTFRIAQGDGTPIPHPAQYSTFRCTVCTQYHGQEDCNPSMVAHVLRNL